MITLPQSKVGSYMHIVSHRSMILQHLERLYANSTGLRRKYCKRVYDQLSSSVPHPLRPRYNGFQIMANLHPKSISETASFDLEPLDVRDYTRDVMKGMKIKKGQKESAAIAHCSISAYGDLLKSLPSHLSSTIEELVS